MNCTFCGANVENGSLYCYSCGAEAENPEQVVKLPGSIFRETGDSVKNTVYGNNPGAFPSGNPPEDLEKIKGWNWGAFLFNFIWAFTNSPNTAIICLAISILIPFGGFLVGLYLGANGNELAWKNRKFRSVDEFRETQKKWTIAGIIMFILSVGLGLLALYLSYLQTNH